MTLFDQQTDVLPQPQPQWTEAAEPAPVRLGLLLSVLGVVLLVLAASSLVIAEILAHGESERAVADEVRTRLALPAGERVEVDIAGSVLLQTMVGRFDDIGVAIYSYPTGPSNADVMFTMQGLQRVDDEWEPQHVSGAMTFSAAQAAALMVPAKAQSAMRVDFSGGDVVVSGSAQAGTTPVTASVAVTPRFENGRFGASISSVTIGGKSLSAEEVAAQTGADLTALQPASVCLAELVPSALHIQDVRVDDDRLRMDFDIDVAAVETAAGRALGTCP